LNIGALIAAISAAFSESDRKSVCVLVVDDASPDGTADQVRMAQARLAGSGEIQVELLIREGERGRGSAGVAGMQWCLDHGATEIVEMDADFSHPPELLPRLFGGLRSADVVVASRLHSESKDLRPWHRRALTLAANLYVRLLLQRRRHGSRLRDWTTGYRAYRATALTGIGGPSVLRAKGPSILQELMARLLRSGASVTEIPFEMVDRKAGVSSLSARTLIHSLARVPSYWHLS